MKNIKLLMQPEIKLKWRKLKRKAKKSILNRLLNIKGYVKSHPASYLSSDSFGKLKLLNLKLLRLNHL